MSDTLLPDQTEKANSTNGADSTIIVEDPIVVPATSGASRGSTPEDAHQPDLVVMPQGQEILMQQGVPQLYSHLAYLRQSYLLRGFSLQASDLMLASWRDKTNSNYGSSFSKWPIAS